MPVKYEIYYEFRIKKNGQPGKFLEMHSAAYTPINSCDICGLLGPAKKVHVRSDCVGWNSLENDYTTQSKHMLCMACWNRVRRIVEKEMQVARNKTLINKVYKEISRERKQRQ